MKPTATFRQTDCRTGWQVFGPTGWETYRRYEAAIERHRELYPPKEGT